MQGRAWPIGGPRPAREGGASDPSPPPAEEPKRYAAAVAALRRQWDADRASKPIGEATGATLAWISVVKT